MKQSTLFKDSQKTTLVKLRRKGNKIVQGCDVYIGRRCMMGGWNLPQSKWANPFRLQDYEGNIDLVLKKYKEYILSKPELIQSLHELKGKVLGCWCMKKPTDKCHGQILIQLIETHVK